MVRFQMCVYTEGGGLQDCGEYLEEESALKDLINYDIPKGRYGIIEGSPQSDGEYRTITEAKKALARVRKAIKV
jgi:hypothetical protein